jgi:hypothetical protein
VFYLHVFLLFSDVRCLFVSPRINFLATCNRQFCWLKDIFHRKGTEDAEAYLFFCFPLRGRKAKIPCPAGLLL